MTTERRYSEAELHAIFERAAKRQEEAQRAEAASRGALTLTELQEIGAASGIDPAHIAAAAAELNAPPPKDVHTFLGAPSEVERTRVVPYDVSDDEWARMVAEIRRAFDDDGSIGQIGQMREWTAVKRTTNNAGTAMRLTLEPAEGGGTRLSLRHSAREVTKGATLASAVSGAMSVLFFVLLVFGADPEMWVPGLMMGGMAFAFAGITRAWLGYWGDKQEDRFDSLLDRLELIARAAEPEHTTEAAPPTEATETENDHTESRLDLDSLPDEADSTGAAERRRTQS